ncbi:MAG: ABC transporter substrate-binding protein [Bradyrhizobiaceae bacterium]|nr:ABC transporter substrate-binding protein [Bradyrhizobiaceae bacterium]
MKNARCIGAVMSALAIATLAIALPAPAARAQQPKEVEVGLLVPLSGLYARFGTVMRRGAEASVERINATGGVKALGGAKLRLIVLDCGDTAEKAKSAAQRMVSEYPDMVALSGSYLSTLTLATSEVTERAHLPMLTLSFSDLIVQRGFKYIFQTSASSASQAEQSLPVIMKIAKSAGGDPKTVAIITDNTAASVASVKPMREHLIKDLGLRLVVDETFTPPLADATPLVQKVRAARADLLFFLPTVISDGKLVLEKMNEFGMGKGRVPTIGFGIAMFEPDMLQTMSPDLLEGMIGAIGSWGAKGHEEIAAELKKRYNEPYLDQNGLSTYADFIVIRDALEIAGKADREAVATALHTMDGGPSKYYPGGRIKFAEDGRRIDAGLTVIQWQSGTPVAIYPPELAVATPLWPKR